MDVRRYVRFEKEGELIVIIHNPDFIDHVIKNPLIYEASPKKAKLKKLKSQLSKEIRYQVDFEKKLLEFSMPPPSMSNPVQPQLHIRFVVFAPYGDPKAISTNVLFVVPIRE